MMKHKVAVMEHVKHVNAFENLESVDLNSNLIINVSLMVLVMG